MIVHNHNIDEEDVLVMHANKAEIEGLLDVLSNALKEYPEAEEFLVTLGKVDTDGSV